MMPSTWLDELTSRLIPVEESDENGTNLRPAGVLMVIYQDPKGLHIPLIRRAQEQGVHSGQIALPGGAREPEDASLLETALREAREEVGLDNQGLRVLGKLLPVHVTVSGFIVTPFVVWANTPPKLAPNTTEVAEILYLPLRVLADASSVREVPNPPGSRFPTMYEYRLPTGRLWGATARMIHDLAERLPPLD